MDTGVIEEKLKNHEEKLHDHEERLEKLEDTYTTLSNLDYRMGRVENTIDSIDKKFDKHIEKMYDERSNNLNEKGKKWDKFIDYLFYFVIATILGFVAMKLGVK